MRLDALGLGTRNSTAGQHRTWIRRCYLQRPPIPLATHPREVVLGARLDQGTLFAYMQSKILKVVEGESDRIYAMLEEGPRWLPAPMQSRPSVRAKLRPRRPRRLSLNIGAG
ncbi:hypothetical protein PUNSTDRAFT_55042 [Punctularia strigosozonata HHB-11173 SS5]|uniref:Uncharacterized protein n=1 Tax=Punctularia strigosozonata (strain HHB-11173) TaxID=741275 RepID=R7S422_PUNST|nr:uncharacterized protein PUNSTDRAFT_55042 [Punctularia strigosozonata HHB-11173 SS5]EIN05130.1 hypothetical protein PUNSTDRAFT_55042 [Punctularia strigosozonata HHB-11173 SS5]